MKGRLVRVKLTENAVLDFNKVSAGKGVYHLSLYNNGQTTAVLDDATREEIEVGDTFIVESPVPIVNENFSVIFNNEKGKQNSLIVSYIIALNC